MEALRGPKRASAAHALAELFRSTRARPGERGAYSVGVSGLYGKTATALTIGYMVSRGLAKSGPRGQYWEGGSNEERDRKAR